MDIFSDLLAGSSSSPNAAVLEQIQKLSTQIVALQNDVNAQFIRVDSTLNTILANLSSDFSQLSADSHAIQVGLLDLQTQLNQLAVYNSAYQQAEENDALTSVVTSKPASCGHSKTGQLRLIPGQDKLYPANQ